jgi:hypothetical protein
MRGGGVRVSKEVRAIDARDESFGWFFITASITRIMRITGSDDLFTHLGQTVISEKMGSPACLHS